MSLALPKKQKGQHRHPLRDLAARPGFCQGQRRRPAVNLQKWQQRPHRQHQQRPLRHRMRHRGQPSRMQRNQRVALGLTCLWQARSTPSATSTAPRMSLAHTAVNQGTRIALATGLYVAEALQDKAARSVCLPYGCD